MPHWAEGVFNGEDSGRDPARATGVGKSNSQAQSDRDRVPTHLPEGRPLLGGGGAGSRASLASVFF